MFDRYEPAAHNVNQTRKTGNEDRDTHLFALIPTWCVSVKTFSSLHFGLFVPQQ